MTTSLDTSEDDLRQLNCTLCNTAFVRKDLQRQAKKAQGSELDEGDSAAAVITALDIEDGWKKSAEGKYFLTSK